MSLVCPKCNRECKDKKGYTLHVNRCGLIHEYVCDECNSVFKTKGNLTKHIERCRVRQQNIEAEKIGSIETEYQSRLEEKEHLITELDQKYRREMEQRLRDKEKEIEYLRFCHQEELRLKDKECSATVSRMQEDCKREVKLRDDDVKAYARENREKQDTIQSLTSQLQEVKTQLEKALVDAHRNKEEAFYHARKRDQIVPSSASSGITNTGNNNVNIQVFNPILFQGHINPPTDLATDMDQLVNLLFNKGFGNFLRISDKSRNVGLWNKAGEGIIRDPHCNMLVEETLNTLNPDFLKQKAWLTEQIRQIEELPESQQGGVGRYYRQLEFTNRMIEKSVATINELKKQIGLRAKDKNDTTVDPIVNRTYHTFTTAFYQFFTSRVATFAFESVQEIGKRFAREHQDLFATEGGSKEKQFIVVFDDAKQPILCDANMLQSILFESLEAIFRGPLQEYLEQWIGLVEQHSGRAVKCHRAYQEELFVMDLLRGMIDFRMYR